MKRLYILMLAVVSLSEFSCKNPEKEGNNTKAAEGLLRVKDNHTQSNAGQVWYRHLSLDLLVNFDNRRISGTATWDIVNVKKAAEAVLDANGGLAIEQVWVDGVPGTFTQSAPVPFLGQALHIPIKPDSKTVKIQYHTSDSATALKWLTPEQTAGKTQPFLYTQSEATFARTWVPCPDGPGIRFTYEARVQAPKNLLALMSAENPQVINDSGIYHFKMVNPIPAYLLALAVGELRFRGESAITGVYAEPVMIEDADLELKQIGSMVTTAEELYGPYRWGRYDVLILPPSFPIGGMENPRLTFATPTIIAGDRSLVNLIAHELAHNWSGNLVTSATWDDIWMNEGFTVYLERRITEKMTGKPYVDMLWELGYQDLQTEVKSMGDTSRDTWLKLNLAGRSADEGLSDIPYEKGSLFLRLVEESVGRERFDPFLKNYFDSHAFSSITTEEFVDYLKANLIQGDSALSKKINMNAWIYGPGIPANVPVIRSQKFIAVDSARAQFLAGTQPPIKTTQDWSTHEWLHFLRGMPPTSGTARLARLDKAYGLTGVRNAEIADLWYTIAATNHYQPAYVEMEKFLSHVGRQKFLEPLYKALINSGQQALAQTIFDRYKNNYHPLAQEMVTSLFQKNSPR